MNVRGARLARQAADEAGGRFVAGSIGPLNVTLSLSPRVEDPAYRAVTFDAGPRRVRGADRGARRGRRRPAADRDDLRHAQREGRDRRRPRGRAAPAAVDLGDDRRPERPDPVRADRRGVLELDRARRAAGRRRELLARRRRDAPARRRPGPARRHLRRLPPERRPARTRSAATTRRRRRPAGLLGEFAESGLVNIVGGCCGTTPGAHRADRRARSRAWRRATGRPRRPTRTRFSGLEPFEIGPDTGFVMIGERTNVTGSARFRRLIESDDHQAAVDVALEQVRGGANLLDVNMDADLLDSEQAMTTFLNLIATEPEVARIPIMIDSSKWTVLEAGLKCVQGKGVVNSISLKEGEEPFLAQARRIRDYGAGVVVMAFDEQGQADTAERKVAICGRAYDLLTQKAGFPPEDIIFDPNVLAVATGIAEHNGYAKAFIDALPLIKERCPGVAHQRRHLQPVVLLPRQRRRPRGDALGVPATTPCEAGLDMGIVNAGQLAVYQDIPADLLELVEDVLFDRRDGRHRPAGHVRRDGQRHGHPARGRPVLARGAGRASGSSHALVHGIVDFIEDDTEEARQQAAAAARRDRGPADGRHEGRRRPVRRRQDVPAAGGQERPGDEALGRLPRAVHGGGEGAGPAGGPRRRRPRPGQGRARHGQGRRARHRQEHRRRGARLQQLRGDRPRRDGAGREDPGHRAWPRAPTRSACPA